MITNGVVFGILGICGVWYGIYNRRQLEQARTLNDELAKRIELAEESNQRIRAGLSELSGSVDRNIGTITEAIELIRTIRKQVQSLERDCNRWGECIGSSDSDNNSYLLSE